MAYRLWERIDRLLYERGMTQKELVERSGVSAMTINRLKTQTRPPKSETIHALADALHLDRDEAAVLAGRLPPRGDEQISVRDAVRRSVDFTDEQKRTLLGVIDALDAANRAHRDRADTGRSDDEQQAM